MAFFSQRSWDIVQQKGDVSKPRMTLIMGTSTKTTSTHEGFQWISLDLTRKNADFKPSGYIVSKRKQKWINMDFINIAIVCLRLLPAISYHHRTWAMSENLVLYPKNHLLDLTGLSSFSVIDIANFWGTSTVYTCIHHFKTHPIKLGDFFLDFSSAAPPPSSNSPISRWGHPWEQGN